MSTDQPLPPDPDEAISPVPLGPPPLGPTGIESIPEVIPLRRRDHPILAWIVILTVVGLSVLGSSYRPAPSKPVGAPPAAAAKKDRGPAIEDLEYRYLVGANELLKATGQDIFAQVAELEHGPPAKQLRFAILAGELRGPARALQTLDAIKLPPDASPELVRALAVLRRLYADYARGDFTQAALTEQDRELIRTEFGWLGELALHPAGGPDAAGRQALLDAARRTVLGIVGVVGLMLVGGTAGFVLLVMLLRRALAGQLAGAVRPPIVNGGLYAETFAVWLVLFIALSSAAYLLPFPKKYQLAAIGCAQLLGLLALAWPVFRGVPWAQVRREVGLTAGTNPVHEFLLGFVCYLMALPVLALGVLLTLLLMRLQGAVTGGEVQPPTHPIAESLGEANLLEILVLASLIAPLVEEIMFRGVLYRHLREATWGWRPAGSILVSAAVVSFVFAAIHPQGFLAIPALMGLAFAFTLAREWRGTLLPAMVAHGTSNAIVLMIATVLFD